MSQCAYLTNELHLTPSTLALQAYQRGVHADWKADDNKRKRNSEEKADSIKYASLPCFPLLWTGAA